MSTGDLPQIQVNIDKAPCLECECNIQEEDRKLKHWRTWMDIRKETHNKIILQNGRESGDMIMNSAEDLHEKNENKLIIQYTNVTNKPDKYRGCPNFFELPISLFEKYWKKSPTYFSVLTKEKQCIVPEMLYVRTGDVIKAEKGISAEATKSKLTFLKSKYFQQRRKDLQEKLLEIEPHKPIGDFTIIGTSIPKTKETNLEPKDRSVSPQSAVSINNHSSCLPQILPIIKINEDTFYNKSEGEKLININIEFDVASSNVLLNHFTITNYSTKALRFSWKKGNTSNNFENYNMLNVVKQQSFFFNLNQFVVIPQETKRIPIYFKSTFEGLYKELWILIITPDLWYGKLKLLVKLNCVAVIKSFEVRSAIIKESLQNRARDRIIDESLRKILATIPEKKAAYVVYSYDKATLFEAVNSSFNPINLRPKYIYNKSIVGELEEFYDRIKFDHHPAVWNLNLNTLRLYTKEREMHDKEIQLQEQYKLVLEKICKAKEIRSAREELRQKLLVDCVDKTVKAPTKGGKGKKKPVKSPKSNQSKASKKNKKGKNLPKPTEKPEIIVPLIKPHDIPLTLSHQLEDIIKKLQQPITWANEQQQKLTIAYSLFCAHFDNIQSEITNLNQDFNTDILTIYPQLEEFTSPLPLRMISEYHDDTMMQVKNFRETCGTIYDKEAEAWVREIPIEDYQTRYRAFHCIAEDPKLVKNAGKGKQKQKKGGKEKSSTKSKRTAAKSTTSPKVKEDIQPPRLTVIQYDPYAEVVVKIPRSRAASVVSSTAPSSPTTNTPTPELLPTDEQLYKNNLYTIFYINLSRAVDDLEALLLLQSKISAKHNIIQKVTDGFIVQTVNEPETIKIVDLRRVISESLDSKEAQTETTETRPCYHPLTTAKTTRLFDTTASDSSLWNVLQKPKVPTKHLEPGEYMIMKDSFVVDTRNVATSATHLDVGYSVLECHDKNVQVEMWQLPRNTDCDLYCSCDEEKLHDVYRSTASKLKVKVKTASEVFYPDLMIDGTQNFKFYVDSDEEEQTQQQENTTQNAQAQLYEETLQNAQALQNEEILHDMQPQQHEETLRDV